MKLKEKIDLSIKLIEISPSPEASIQDALLSAVVYGISVGRKNLVKDFGGVTVEKVEALIKLVEQEE